MKATEAHKEIMRKYYKNNVAILKVKKRAYYLGHRDIWKKYQATDHYRELARKYHRELRQEVIKHYGGKCECCLEDIIEFLGIDHINGNGRKHRATFTGSIYQWLKKNNYPQGYRILCHNCNLALGFYKHCPHRKE